MPNLEAAAELLEADTATGSDSEPTEATAPPSGDVESESEPVAVPDPAAERLQAIQARRAERRAQVSESELAEIRKRAEVEAKEAWRQKLRTNAREALGETDDPVETYNWIHESAVAKDSPEYQTKKAIEDAKAEAKKAQEEIAALRAERAAERRQAIVGEFLSAANAEDWTVQYDDEELVTHGDRVANELSKAGKPFGIQDILARLKQEHTDREKRVAARRAKRTPPKTAPQNVVKTVQAAQEPTAIGNQLVSETASASDGKLTKEQRLALADEMVRAPRRRAG